VAREGPLINADLRRSMAEHGKNTGHDPQKTRKSGLFDPQITLALRLGGQAELRR